MEKYKDASLSVAERVDDLISRMTIEQKIAQLQCVMAAGDHPEAIISNFPYGVGEVASFAHVHSKEQLMEANKKIVQAVMEKPLGIPPIIHVEALTGVNINGATIFPCAIGLGATFDGDLVQKMGDIIREQMTAVGYRQALSPVMDVARDPRWGRIGETYGEDPTLNAAMSVAYTKGLQSDDLSNGAVVTGKHFLGYGLSEGGLNMASSPIPPRELREVYAKPFQAAITEGGMQSVMNSYGTIDGEMIINSRHILTELLRDEMKFNGIVLSDYMSIVRAVNYRLCPDMAEAGVEALVAGLDVECPFPAGYTQTLIDAVNAGELDEAMIDRSVRRVLETKFKLGLFENPYPRSEKLEKAFDDPLKTEHSLKAARESVVLLKNDGILPISKSVKRIAVIGPHADSIRMLFGGYSNPASIEMALGRSVSAMAGMGAPEMEDMMGEMMGVGEQDNFVPPEPMEGCEILKEHGRVTATLKALYGSKTPTILSAIKAKCPDAEVIYAQGCEFAGCNRSMFREALEAAKAADIVIVTLGGKYGFGGSATIGEGVDCDDIGLPGIQEEFAKELFRVGTPAVFVHMDARPLSSTFVKENYPAIIENWFPGITGGTALADVLFGDYNPAGRLPVTAARNAGQIPVYVGQKTGNSYYGKQTEMVLNLYAESTTEPLFYFGEGLSYTQFAYSDLHVDSSVKADGTIKISCQVQNVGDMDGEEVVQLYVKDEMASMVRPQKEFAGFKRVALKKGQAKTVTFMVRADQFAFLNKEMDWVVEAGDMTIMIGSSSEDIRLIGKCTIENTSVIEGHKRGFYAQAEIR